MITNRLLHEGNRDMLAHLCMLASRFGEIWRRGGTPPAALLQQFRALAGSLHLAAVNLAGRDTASGKQNTFAKHARRNEPHSN